MARVGKFTTAAFVWISMGFATSSLWACPFCSAVSQTFSEEIDSMDVAVVAKLIDAPAAVDAVTAAQRADVAKTKFEIVEVVKGEELVKGQRTIETLYFGEGRPGSQFLIMAVDPPSLMWGTPLLLSDRARQYVSKLMDLPKEGAQRLVFFQEHLEDPEEMLARDAYDEFAKAPYETVKALKAQMKHDQLVAWIQDVDIPASRRRLYLTMLGVCGQQSDLPMLEEMLKSQDRKLKAGLDAMIACYLTLRGADGLPLIEELFLENEKAEYADTYAAIMALRFHGTEGDVIPKDRIVKSLHYMLDRPQLADLVIPDLARWEDWSQMERLVELFKNADDKSSWVRVPVINYLRACPHPEAEKYIRELEKIDPDSVKRANIFFPYGPAAAPASAPPAEAESEPDEAAASAVEAPQPAAATQTALPAASVQLAAADPTMRATRPAAATTSESTSSRGPNRLLIASVPWAGGAVLMVVMWTILGGCEGRKAVKDSR